MGSKGVRFARIRGRIVPIGVKRGNSIGHTGEKIAGAAAAVAVGATVTQKYGKAIGKAVGKAAARFQVASHLVAQSKVTHNLGVAGVLGVFAGIGISAAGYSHALKSARRNK